MTERPAYDGLDYIWKCSFCFLTKNPYTSCISMNVPIREMDQVLRLTERCNVRASVFRWPLECNVGTALTIARHVTAYYYSKKIRPYLRYTEAVEIDETKIGAQIYKAATKCDEFRWVFGMICRKSRLSAMYFV